MNSADIAAYIGAAAWLPQIATWIHDRWAKPIITIVAARTAEIGFTRFGPIFNLGMALSADRKSAIIDSFEATLCHEDGEVRKLRWAGMSETFSQITDALGNTQIVSKETAIAFKISVDSLLDKFVRFQEPKFFDQTQPVENELVSHFTYLKNTIPDFVSQTLQSRQFHDVIETKKRNFWWRPGKYELSFSIHATEKVNLLGSTYVFSLSHLDVEALKQNFATLDTDLRNLLNSNLPEPQLAQGNWTWRNVTLQKNAQQLDLK